MLAVVKTPHTEIRVDGLIHPRVLSVLEEVYGNRLDLREDDDDLAVPIRETEFWRTTPPSTGGIIDSLRWQKRISQAELARRAGTTRQTISAIERGRRKMGPGMLARIAAALDVPVARLVPPEMDKQEII